MISTVAGMGPGFGFAPRNDGAAIRRHNAMVEPPCGIRLHAAATARKLPDATPHRFKVQENAMLREHDVADPSTWDPALDAVVAAPKNHKVLFENDNMRVLEVTLEADEEEPVHHHRWKSVFVFDQVQGPVIDYAADGTELPPNRDVIKAIEGWDGQGCLVVHMIPQPAGRVLNASGKTIHGIRVEMKI